MTESLNTSSDRLELMSTFIRIVDSKNLSAAALSLNTTQPTISRRLKTLEQSLGLKLIQRTTHKMQMTEEGRRFYHYAKDLVERWAAIEEEMLGAKTSPKGVLRVQVPQALGIGKFNNVLSKYLQSYPKVDIEWLLSDKTPNFISDNLDCAIKVGNIDDPSLIGIKIFELPRIIAASRSLVSIPKTIIHPSELKDCPWLSFKTHYLDEISLFHIKTKEETKLKIHSRFSTDSLLALREVALEGLGVGVFSKWVIEKDLQNQRLIQLCSQWQAASLPVYLIYPQSRLKPAKLKKFIDLLKLSKDQ